MEITLITGKTAENQQIKILSQMLHDREVEEFSIAPKPPQWFVYALTASPRPTYRRDYYIITSNGSNIGFLDLRHNLLVDQEELGTSIYILPEFRHKGYFDQLIQKLPDFIPDHVKKLAMYYYQDTSKDTHTLRVKFENQGLSPAYVERINISDLTQFDVESTLKFASELKEEAGNAGFILLFVEDGKFEDIPELDYNDYVEMVGRIWNDMPIEDADWDEEPVSDEILMAMYKNIKELHGISWNIVAIHEETKTPAGFTQIYFYDELPDVIHQGDTGVDKPFRGHGLGRTLKYSMLAKILTDNRIVNPRIWITGNASSNSHMLKINDELGYTHRYTENYYQVPMSVVHSYIESRKK